MNPKDVDFNQVAALYPWLMSRVEPENPDTKYRLILWQDRALTPEINTWSDEDAIVVWLEDGELYASKCVKGEQWNHDPANVPLDYLGMIAHITHYVQELGWEVPHG